MSKFLWPLSALLVLLVGASVARGEVRIVRTIPGTYLDISAVGTRFDLGDDGQTSFVTTVGNSLLPAGPIRISNNGAVAWGNNGGTGFSNQPLPSGNLASGGQALAVYWDDLYPYLRTPPEAPDGVYVAEIDGTLYITWHLGHISSLSSLGTVQLQVFSSGPVAAQFVYQDVDFGIATLNDGASATIGYQAGGVRNDAQWSFETAGSVTSGTVLSIIDRNAADTSIVGDIPGKYVDISTAGTRFNLFDDDLASFTTTVGNAVLPAGPINISNNGAVSWGQNNGTGFTNQVLPSSNLALGGQALAVYWDDLYTYNLSATERPQGVYVLERNGTLYITWRVGHIAVNNSGGLIQLQVFSSGPVYAQFIYVDVDFVDSFYSNGASATIGYQSGGSGANPQWSFNRANSVHAGTVLSLVDPVPSSLSLCGIDFNGDGSINADDLSDFITAYFGGCP